MNQTYGRMNKTFFLCGVCGVCGGGGSGPYPTPVPHLSRALNIRAGL